MDTFNSQAGQVTIYPFFICFGPGSQGQHVKQKTRVTALWSEWGLYVKGWIAKPWADAGTPSPSYKRVPVFFLFTSKLLPLRVRVDRRWVGKRLEWLRADGCLLLSRKC